jgi:hypothetical protein
MSVDLTNKDYSPGQITQSVWDETDNALRVKSVDGGGGGATDVVETATLDYSSTNVTSAAYVELIASTSDEIKEIEIFDSSGQLLILALGAATEEVDKCFIFPGGLGKQQLSIPAGTRVSLKATSTSATTGLIAVNLFG